MNHLVCVSGIQTHDTSIVPQLRNQGFYLIKVGFLYTKMPQVINLSRGIISCFLYAYTTISMLASFCIPVVLRQLSQRSVQRTSNSVYRIICHYSSWYPKSPTHRNKVDQSKVYSHIPLWSNTEMVHASKTVLAYQKCNNIVAVNVSDPACTKAVKSPSTTLAIQIPNAVLLEFIN